MHRGRLILLVNNYFGCARIQMFWLGNRCPKPLTRVPGGGGCSVLLTLSSLTPITSNLHKNRSFFLMEKFLSMYTTLFSTQILRKEWGSLNPLRFSYYTQVPLKIPVLFNSTLSFLIFSVYSDSDVRTRESLAQRGAACLFSSGKR